MKRAIIFSVLILSLGIVPLMAGGLSFQADLNSRYFWRGFDLYPNNNGAFQPSITYDFGNSGLSVNVWGSFALSNREFLDEGDEVDLTLTYNLKTTDSFSLTIGFIHYCWYNTENFKFGDHTTQEIFAEIGLPKLPFSPTFGIYYDFANGDGLYLQWSAGHSVVLSENLNLDLTATLGFNGGQWLPEDADPGFSHLQISASVPLKLGSTTVIPSANYAFVFMDAINDENELWFGVSLVL